MKYIKKYENIDHFDIDPFGEEEWETDYEIILKDKGYVHIHDIDRIFVKEYLYEKKINNNITINLYVVKNKKYVGKTWSIIEDNKNIWYNFKLSYIVDKKLYLIMKIIKYEINDSMLDKIEELFLDVVEKSENI